MLIFKKDLYDDLDNNSIISNPNYIPNPRSIKIRKRKF